LLIKYDVFQKGLLLLFCGKHSNQAFAGWEEFNGKTFSFVVSNDIFRLNQKLAVTPNLKICATV